MNNAPNITPNNDDLSRWAQSINEDADRNQTNFGSDHNVSKNGKGTSSQLKPKFKQTFEGWHFAASGVEWNATGSFDRNEAIEVVDGTTYNDLDSNPVPADPGRYVCKKAVPPEDDSYWDAVDLFDTAHLQRQVGVIYYPQAAGNDYWFPLGGGTSTGAGGDVWL